MLLCHPCGNSTPRFEGGTHTHNFYPKKNQHKETKVITSNINSITYFNQIIQQTQQIIFLKKERDKPPYIGFVWYILSLLPHEIKNPPNNLWSLVL